MTEMKFPEELYVREELPGGAIITYSTMRQQILHCIGLVGSCSQHHQPYRRHGKMFYRPWRNCFFAGKKNRRWDELCAYGYADHGPVNARGVSYWMTRAGLDWLAEQLGMTIYDKEADHGQT